MKNLHGVIPSMKIDNVSWYIKFCMETASTRWVGLTKQIGDYDTLNPTILVCGRPHMYIMVRKCHLVTHVFKIQFKARVHSNFNFNFNFLWQNLRMSIKGPHNSMLTQEPWQ